MFATVIILSMAMTPLLMIAADRLLRTEASKEGIDAARDLQGRILVIGFGRFGQISSQVLLSRGVKLSVIDNDPERIRDAGRYGFKVQSKRQPRTSASGIPSACPGKSRETSCRGGIGWFYNRSRSRSPVLQY
nr:NAD-binding protein [Steroidobacter cummioxidans]